MRPPPHVLAAFGVDEAPEPLSGGQGTAWRCGDLVLKPLDASVGEVKWQGHVLQTIVPDGFRVPRLRGVSGGWCGWELLAGEHRERAWPEVIEVGERFHRALVGVPRPVFLDRRTDFWAIGDRVAWGELPAAEFGHVRHLRVLVQELRPVDETGSQLVHSDLTGNVLYADGLPPAVIDFSPLWRPPAFAAAIVVGDALLWEGADESLLAAVGHVEEFPQFLLRALIFRAVVDALFRPDRPPRAPEDDVFAVPVQIACALAE